MPPHLPTGEEILERPWGGSVPRSGGKVLLSRPEWPQVAFSAGRHGYPHPGPARVIWGSFVAQFLPAARRQYRPE